MVDAKRQHPQQQTTKQTTKSNRRRIRGFLGSTPAAATADDDDNDDEEAKDPYSSKQIAHRGEARLPGAESVERSIMPPGRADLEIFVELLAWLK